MKKTLITGATGFLGQQLIKSLLNQEDIQLSVSTRTSSELFDDPRITVFFPKELAPETNWQDALSGCEVIIHTAARVHMLKDGSIDPVQAYRKINVEGSLNLARQAAESGVKRFIFISTIHVNGNNTSNNQAFSAEDNPNPRTPYALSKFEAEQALQQLSAATGMELIIIRPPLVYGPGVKANFNRLIAWLHKGLPLPLGAINNRRSFVAIDNLISLIITCINHPRAANQIFLVSDGEDISTTLLLQKMSQVMHKPAYLLSVPPVLLKWVASLLGKRADFERLNGSLQIDISKTCSMLDWRPKLSLDQALMTYFSKDSSLG